MKKKIITVVLSVLLILSVALNIYIWNLSKSINSDIESLVVEIEDLTDKAGKLDSDISNKESELVAMQTEVTTLEEKIAELEVENEDLEVKISEAQEANKEKLKAGELIKITDWAKLAETIAKASIEKRQSEGSPFPATGGAPIEVPPAKEYVETGRICY